MKSQALLGLAKIFAEAYEVWVQYSMVVPCSQACRVDNKRIIVGISGARNIVGISGATKLSVLPRDGQFGHFGESTCLESYLLGSFGMTSFLDTNDRTGND